MWPDPKRGRLHPTFQLTNVLLLTPYNTFFFFDFTNMNLYRVFSFVWFFFQIVQAHLVHTFAHGDSQGSSLSHHAVTSGSCGTKGSLQVTLSWHLAGTQWLGAGAFIKSAFFSGLYLPSLTPAWHCQFVICGLRGTFTYLSFEEGFLSGLQHAN